MQRLINGFWDAMRVHYKNFLQLLPQIMLAAFVFAITLGIAFFIRRWLQPRILSQTKDTLLTGFLAQLGYWVIMIIGISMALGFLGFEGVVTKILAGAGLSAFILGFALKDIGENFLAGILLAFQRPFRIGDRVESNGINGHVSGMTLRETIIKTLDGKDVYMPNGLLLKSPLINYSVDGYLRIEFTVCLACKTDLPQAVAIMLTTLNAVPDILQEQGRQPEVGITDVNADVVQVKSTFWIHSFHPDKDSVRVKNEAIQAVLEALTKAGYEISAS